MALRYVVVSFSLLFYVRHCLSIGFCSRTESAKSNVGIFYYKEYFCCDNYEAQKEVCHECPTGFTSKAGSKCIPCPGNTYGLRCAEHCKCHDDERCDHEHGCVKLGDETITIDKSDASTNKIISYGIGGGSAISAIILIALSVFICWRYRLMKKKERLDSIHSNAPLTQQSNVSNTVEDQSTISEEAHDYEEIDEIDIPCEPITSSNTNDSNDNSVTDGADNEGYLHPYHSLNYPDIIQENDKEREKNDIDMNIQEKYQYSLSVKD
ncbi:uncharacterized protein LOC127705559 [Mytilus californianus]|uniref:uncharacterized protein LOC127705559 n=1 Tax=Mytilus californianus TaxID=6549 RepID=UPI0022468A19|nr:uncharacterized protein LOC127705559 [Mytilus californianus]